MSVSVNDKNKIEQLKHLLMDKEFQRIDKIERDLKKMTNTIHPNKGYEKKIHIIIEDRLDQFQKEFPEKMGPTVIAALKKQVDESRKDVIDTLHPLIGKLIFTYVRKEIKSLSNRIDKQYERVFSFDWWRRKFKALFSGLTKSEILIRETVAPVLEEIFIIKKGAGTLMAHYSKTHRLHSDMIAGMLTAIKTFSEDTFSKDNVELELLDYETYEVRIFNIGTYYFAAVISGQGNNDFNEEMKSAVMNFVELYMKKEQLDESNVKLLSKQLKKHFHGFRY